MIARVTRIFKQCLAAIMLIMMLTLGAEIVLRTKSTEFPATAVARTSADLQSILVPSSTTHHAMEPFAAYSNGSGTGFRTNSLGLRGPEPVVPKPGGVFRIVLLGDETILGHSLRDEHTVASWLERFLSNSTGLNVEIINAGVPGYCPMLSAIQCRREILQLEPDLLIVHFDMSDVADDACYRRQMKEANGYQVCQNPVLQQISAPAANGLVKLAGQSALLQLLRRKAGLTDTSSASNSLKQRYEWTIGSGRDLRLQIKHALEPVEQFATVGNTQKIAVLLSSTPLPWQIGDAADFPELAAAISDFQGWRSENDTSVTILQAMCERTGLTFCDSSKAFGTYENPESLYISGTTELSARGSALYAHQIASTLLSEPGLAEMFRTAQSRSVHATETTRQ